MAEVKPILTVLMPAFNCEEYVGEAISSVLRQTYPHFELLIVDDASSDATLKIIRSFKDERIKVFENLKNLGKTASVNRLVEQIRGEFVTIHDSDDLSKPMRFENQVEFLVSNPDVGVTGCGHDTVDRKGNIIMTYEASTSPTVAYEHGFCGATIVFRREVIARDGYIYRDFFRNYNEDVDMWLRFRDHYKLQGISKSLYQYRLLPGSLSNHLTPHKQIIRKIVDALALQRKLRDDKLDNLMLGLVETVESDYIQLLRPYEEDPSLIHRENASWSFHQNFLLPALVSSLAAVRVHPKKLINYRTLYYIARRSVIKVIGRFRSAMGNKYTNWTRR